jgi:uncharacterized membrane protein
MRRITILMLLAAFIFMTNPGFTQAQSSPNFDVTILSPGQIKEFPGTDQLIKVRIVNRSGKEMKDVFSYITMANLTKTWTVNLEDYSADQATPIGTMKPGEEITVDLPIQLVYAAKYYLYVTVISKESTVIASSDAIPIEIMGNTKIVPLQVQVVAIAVPLILLIMMIYAIKRKK